MPCVTVVFQVFDSLIDSILAGSTLDHWGHAFLAEEVVLCLEILSFIETLSAALAYETVLMKEFPFLGHLASSQRDCEQATTACIGSVAIVAVFTVDFPIFLPVCLPLERQVTLLTAEVLLVPVPLLCFSVRIREDELSRR